ncbi:cytochrome c [Roseomonas sp. M0104]|uniref:Cytochrome c n=1 Tax=Teichococcus coralli TaxID=2545983 RepID=A0A845BGY1_9PROT|nr:c-type cytochrome [Pseudoroseomonas coralli]MXP65340.1 cytochrome c [Pseudoroseomonas coralli]
MRPGRARRIALVALAALAMLLLGAAFAAWMLLRPGPQQFRTAADRFAYGSTGGEALGIPYPVFMVLPRVFPDLVARYAREGYGPAKAGFGGWGAFGLAWEQGERLPAGFSIERVGYDRVTVNCALCHTATWRPSAEADRQIAPGGPGHAVNLQGMLRFMVAAAHDRRFTAARLLPEILLNFPLSWAEAKLYAWLLIPATRAGLRFAGGQLAWMEDRPPWAPGRDDAFNLPKFILTQTPWDNSTGNTDFPALWRLGERDGMLLHASGEAHDVYTVAATSALGTGALPLPGFRARNEWLVAFLRDLPAPPFPEPVDAALAEAGRAIFVAQCAACHARGGARTGTAIPLDEIGTDPERARTWTAADAARMNRLTGLLGMEDARLQAAQGYVARPLTGLWLLAPYLHNGSVPTLRDLLLPPAQRPRIFWRGYDVLDRANVGFLATGPEAEAEGFRFDTGLRGNGNGGHLYGTALDGADREALLAYLKTL